MACQSRRFEYVGLEPTKTTQPPLVVLDHVLSHRVTTVPSESSCPDRRTPAAARSLVGCGTWNNRRRLIRLINAVTAAIVAPVVVAVSAAAATAPATPAVVAAPSPRSCSCRPLLLVCICCLVLISNPHSKRELSPDFRSAPVDA